MVEWQSAEDRNNREKSDRARQAAEDLFKPTTKINRAEIPNAAPQGAAAEPARRQPRVFAAPARLPFSAEPETPPPPKPARRRTMSRREATTVPPSQIGRIRALTSYGMTPAQVAELYGVTVEHIEQIIKDPARLGRSR